MLVGDFGGVMLVAENIEDYEGRADGDGGVGDVERGIVIAAEADFEEVGDGAVEDAVGDVASGSAEKECQAGGGHGASGVSGGEEPGEGGNDDDRAADEEHASPRRGGVGEDAEGEATLRQPSDKPGVLVVDDEDLVRIMVQMGLEQNGFDVWLRNLRAAGADVLFVAALEEIVARNVPADGDGFPVERAWADAHPALFHLRYASPAARVYGIAP